MDLLCNIKLKNVQKLFVKNTKFRYTNAALYSSAQDKNKNFRNIFLQIMNFSIKCGFYLAVIIYQNDS